MTVRDIKNIARRAPIQADLFDASKTGVALKDHMEVMSYPFLQITKNPVMTEQRFDINGRVATMLPSSKGLPTVADWDLIVFSLSQLAAAMNKGEPISYTVEFDVYDYLRETKRSDSVLNYHSVRDALIRLYQTTITTNIQVGDLLVERPFRMLEDFTILSEGRKPDPHKKSSVDKDGKARQGIPLRVRMVLGEWVYTALAERRILTIGEEWFDFNWSEKRLYQIMRRHLGNNALWYLGLEELRVKMGFSRPVRALRMEIRSIIQRQPFPDFRIALDARGRSGDNVVAYTRSNQALTKWLAENGKGEWFMQLEKQPTSAGKTP